MSVVMLDRVVRVGTMPHDLDAVIAPDVAMALWMRAPPATLMAALATLDLDTVDDVTLDVMADDLAGDRVETALCAAFYPGRVARPLAADIAALLHHQARLTGADHLTLRLEGIETDACRRFHSDYVTLRLLCTYVGPATQWHLVATPDAVEQLPTGAVAVLKGRRLLDPPTLLHRSPPIAGTGTRRLLLVIDPARPDGPAG